MFKARQSRNPSELLFAVPAIWCSISRLPQFEHSAACGAKEIQNILFVLSPLSLGSAGLPCRWNPEAGDSQKSLNSSYWPEADHSEVSVFKVTVGGFGFRAASGCNQWVKW